MARLITVEITGESGKYSAAIQRIQEQNARLYRDAERGSAQMIAQVRILEQGFSSLQSILGRFATITGLTLLAKQAIDTASRFQDLSDVTHISAQTLSGLNNLLEQSGITVDDFANGVVRLQKSLIDSRGKTDQFSVSMRELLKFAGDPNGFLEAFSKKLASIENPAQRTAFALEAASRGGARLAPIFQQIAEQGLDKFRNSAAAMSDDTIRKLDELGDSFTQFKNQALKSVAEGIGGLGDFAASVRSLGTAVGQAIAFIAAHKETILLLGAAVAALTGHWIAAAAALASYIGLSSQYRGTLGELNALNEKQLALEKQLSIVEEARRLGQRSGLTNDVVYNKILQDKAAIEKRKQELIDLIREDNDKPTAKAGAPGLPDLPDQKLINERQQLLDQLTRQANDAASAFAKLADPVKAVDIQMSEWLDKIAKLNGLTPQQARELTNLVEVIRKYNLAVIEKNREDERQKQLMQDYIAFGKQLDAQKQEELELEQKLVDIKIRANQHDVDRLRAAGATEDTILAEQIKALQREREILENAPIKEPGKIADVTRQIEIAEIQLARLKNSGIDVAGEVARTVTDITGAVIQGTLKWADIGRSVLASFVRIALDQFTTFLRNIQTASQTNAILGAGTVASGGGSGGILGAIFSGLANSGLGQLFSGLLGGGSAGGGILSGIFGGTGGGGGIFGGIGSLVSSGLNLVSASFGLTGGATLGTLAATAALNISGAISTTLQTAVATALNTLDSLYWIPYIGWIIAAITLIYRIVANQQERPNLKQQASFGGIGFNPETMQFTPGAITTGTFDRTGISRSQAGNIASNLQERLTMLADQWVGILNLFPSTLREQIIPALDETNRRLNVNFSRLKFSPGGSRSIQQELESISGVGGQTRFLDAFLPAITAGLTATLQRAGIPFDRDLINAGFGSMPPAANQAGFDFLIEQIKKIIGLAGSFANVSPRGLGQFLNEIDIGALSAAFGGALGTPNVQGFSNIVSKLEEALKPLSDFLNSAIQQSTDLFGRGLVAAMEAATESDARLAFMNTLGTGIKDVVFQGLTQAFIASAQFNDLLAPIQKIIRDFTQQAILTGVPPDVGAFRAAILPGIEDITTRASLLQELIDALQELGFEIRDKLGLLPKTEQQPQQITINVSGGNPQETAREIAAILRRTLPPPV